VKWPWYLYQALTAEKATAVAATITCPFRRVALKILQEMTAVTQKAAQ